MIHVLKGLKSAICRQDKLTIFCQCLFIGFQGLNKFEKIWVRTQCLSQQDVSLSISVLEFFEICDRLPTQSLSARSSWPKILARSPWPKERIF